MKQVKFNHNTPIESHETVKIWEHEMTPTNTMSNAHQICAQLYVINMLNKWAILNWLLARFFLNISYLEQALWTCRWVLTRRDERESPISFQIMIVQYAKICWVSQNLWNPHRAIYWTPICNGRRKFFQPQKWMRQRVFSAWGIQTGPSASL